MLDPLFKQTCQKFDELSIGNLMTSTLNINSHLLIQLDSKMEAVQNLPMINGLDTINEEDEKIEDEQTE